MVSQPAEPVSSGRVVSRLIDLFGPQAVLQNLVSASPQLDPFQQIDTALMQWGVSVVVAVIGPAWLAGQALDNPYDLVRMQLETALRRGVPVIPVLVDSVQFPRPEQVPPSLQPLLLRNGIPLRAGRDAERDIARLGRALSAWVPPLPLPLDVAKRRSSRATWIWGSALGVAVIVVGLISSVANVALATALRAGALNPVTVVGFLALAVDLALFGVAGYAKVRSLGSWATGTGAGLMAGLVGGVGCGIVDVVAMPLYTTYTMGPSAALLGGTVGVFAGVFFLGLDLGLGAAMAAIGGRIARRRFARPAPAYPPQYASPVYSAPPGYPPRA